MLRVTAAALINCMGFQYSFTNNAYINAESMFSFQIVKVFILMRDSHTTILTLVKTKTTYYKKRKYLCLFFFLDGPNTGKGAGGGAADDGKSKTCMIL